MNCLKSAPLALKETTHFFWKTGTLHLGLNDAKELALKAKIQATEFSLKQVISHCSSTDLKIRGLFNVFIHNAVSKKFELSLTDLEILPINDQKESKYQIKEIICKNGARSITEIILLRWLKAISHKASSESVFDHFNNQFKKAAPALPKQRSITPPKYFKISENSAFHPAPSRK
jgi:hypothetical protein